MKFKLIIPGIFLVFCGFFYSGLFSDPMNIENVQVERQFPSFKLKDLMDDSIEYTAADVKGQVTLVNVWGVWCVTCRIELPFLTQLRQVQGMRIVGVYYDNAADAVFGDVDINQTRKEVVQMLGQYGDPFVFNIYDAKRDLSLDLGITGAPEHFLVDVDGTIVWHRRGDINPRIWQDELAPIYQGLLSKQAKGAN
ncbi:redoxin family protein [Marinifaba aquimaris]|uniref:redoxin family protein n=1 Tax=Marinifaba aquimaris TaxID=2741323 RepID=UPI0031B5D676